MKIRHTQRGNQRGFSLIEMMITVLILSIIVGAIFQQITLVQQRSATEQTKLDMFQESREFLDQMSRDLHQAGYPSPRNFSSLTANASYPTSPFAKSSAVAVGLTYIDNGDLWFEGDVDGTGNVSVVQYHYDNSTANNCPCLRRSQNLKVPGDPATPTTLAGASPQSSASYQVEVQNVQNGASTNPIFYAYAHGNTGTPLTLPLDFYTDPATIASIDTIKIVLTVQSNTTDPKTGLRPITSLVSTVKLNNCSAASSGQFMSCQ